MKRIEIKVIPNARKNFIQQEGDKYKVHLAAPPVDGKANRALIEFLAIHFNVKRSRVKILKGEKSQYKIIEIEE